MADALLSLRLASKREIARDVVLLELRDPQDRPLPPWSPGAHVDLHLPGGLLRQYSLAGDCDDASHWLLAVLKEPASRGGSRAVHEALQEGDLIQVGLPRNQFALHGQAHGALLLAGGIGITPILAMARSLLRQQAPFHLHYCGRTRGGMAFLDELESGKLATKTSVHIDLPGQGSSLDLPSVLAALDPDAHIYVCGPRGFIDWVRDTALAAGRDPASLHQESFSAAAPPADADSFEVHLQQSGLTITVSGEESVLHALQRAGVQLQTSCEQGICGTCMTTVLEGEPVHLDLCLSEEERNSGKLFLPCCSRAKGRLVLDL